MSSTPAVYVGIDTSKQHLDVAIGCDSKPFQVPNTRDGIARIAKRLSAHSVAMVVMESTGVYSRLAARELATAGYAVAVVQPGRVRSFAKSQGQRAKTDPIDARMLAAFGEASKGLTPYQPPSAVHDKLRALVDRRGQLIEDRVRESNRLEACVDDEIGELLRKKHRIAEAAGC